MSGVRLAAFFSVVIALITGLAGCVRGGRFISESHESYNEAIRDRLDEELLLNLVRMRYRDRTLFLQVNSVIARFVRQGIFNTQAGVSAPTASGSSPTVSGGIGLELEFSEQPTVTYTPLQGEDFAERMLRPIDLETLALLQRSGWNIDRVMRLTVQRLNGLDNASGASGPTPSRPPDFREFVEAVEALKLLQHRRGVVIGNQSRSTVLSEPLHAKNVTAADVLTAANAGQTFKIVQPSGELPEQPQELEEGEETARPPEKLRRDSMVVLTSTQKRIVLHITASEENEAVTQRFTELLGLQPGRRAFDLEPAVGDVRELLGNPGERQRIVLVTRSLLGVLFFLSHAVEVPQEHCEAGIVTVTQDSTGETFDWNQITDGLLRIRSSVERPENVAIAVPYRGYWYSISDDDLTSKSTFTLMTQLYDLLAGDPVSGSSPIPTIPIGG